MDLAAVSFKSCLRLPFMGSWWLPRKLRCYNDYYSVKQLVKLWVTPEWLAA